MEFLGNERDGTVGWTRFPRSRERVSSNGGRSWYSRQHLLLHRVIFTLKTPVEIRADEQPSRRVSKALPPPPPPGKRSDDTSKRWWWVHHSLLPPLFPSLQNFPDHETSRSPFFFRQISIRMSFVERRTSSCSSCGQCTYVKSWRIFEERNSYSKIFHSFQSLESCIFVMEISRIDLLRESLIYSSRFLHLSCHRKLLQQHELSIVYKSKSIVRIAIWMYWIY